MISFKTILGFLFILLIASVAILSVVSYQNNENTLRTAKLVNDTYDIIYKCDQVSSSYQDTRLSVNQIIIMNDASRYPQYAASSSGLFSRLAELRQLAVKTGNGKPSIDSLETSLRSFLVVSDSIINLVRGKHSEDSIEKIFIKSIELRNNVTSKISFIKQRQNAILQKHQLANSESLNAFMVAFNALLLGIAVLVLSTFLVTRYNFNKRQKAQEELRRAHVLFEKIFYESPTAIAISELESGKIVNCNRGFARTLNYSIHEMLGKTLVELGVIESEKQRSVILGDAEHAGVVRHTEVYIKPKDKDQIYVSIDAHVVSLSNKKCLLTSLVDLSTHKRAEDETKKALEAEIELNKLKSSLVTLASHEFRTPLTTILSSAFLLENFIGAENKEKCLKHLTRIKSSVNNLTSILDEFLSVTKIEEGQIKPNLEKTDLPQFVAGICTNLQTFAKPGQTIHYSHTGKNEITTDPVLLGNILSNLVTNSIKYSNDNSPIYVKSLVNSRVHLTVQDHGIGIPEPDQKRLFQRFYRASNAGAVQGTGLGLHIMKHYVEMLKGSVKLTSEPGKGTQVEVTFENPE
ncbi:MAG TPA: ATP-binding protein [Chryseosolibacter sp.]